MIVDLFAGPGGWSEGLRLLGLADIGFEWDEAACATRAAAGHRTIRADVAAYPTGPFAGRVVGLIASPPCQLFSTAGQKHGRSAIELIAAGMRDLAAGRDTREQVRSEAAAAIGAAMREEAETAVELQQIDDDLERLAYNACLVLEPARWAFDLEPEWIALEQVPAVLPLWGVLAGLLRERGYRAGCWVLNAADYGVPQTRRRAILMAHRTRPVAAPEPTHAERPVASLFGPELQPWVSMADALGWIPGDVQTNQRTTSETASGYYERDTDRPSPTVTSKVDLWRRGVVRSSTRKADRGNPGIDGIRERSYHPVDQPAPTLTGKARSWELQPGQWQAGTSRRRHSMHEPAPTLAFGNDFTNWRWFEQPDASSEPACEECGCPEWMHDAGGYCAGPCGGECTDGGRRLPNSAYDDEGTVLNTGRDWQPGGTRADAQQIAADRPAPAVSSQADAWEWQPVERNDQSGILEDPTWPGHRPATTIMSRPLVTDPGTIGNRFNGSERTRNDGYRITIEEASVLQSIHPRYPWQGSRTKQFEQVGNMVPPLLAAHIVHPLHDDDRRDDATRSA
jgi:DNA (cytosine-5)-methyltransferase 1